MFISQKIKTKLAKLIGVNPDYTYEEQYKNTGEILECLDKEFQERLSCCRITTKESYRSFDTTLNELGTEINSLIQTCEVKQNAGSGGTKRSS